jgi:hypothetical protein
MPPQGLLDGHGIIGRFHDADVCESVQLVGETPLQESYPAGAHDQEWHQLETVHGDRHARLDAERGDLAGGGGIVGSLVRHPRQSGQVVEGELLTDFGVVVGDEEDPAVLVELDRGEAANDAVGQQ